MIVFEELRINNNGTHLIVKVRVSNEAKYDNILITGIRIGSSETYQEGNIGGSTITFDSPAKFQSIDVINASVDTNTIDFKKNLIFVEVLTSGSIDPACDCECANDKIGVTMYMRDVYNNFLNMIKEVGDNNCEIPNNIIDYFLKFKGLNAAINSKHYLKGIEYYNKWFANNKQTVIGGCGCNG